MSRASVLLAFPLSCVLLCGATLVADASGVHPVKRHRPVAPAVVPAALVVNAPLVVIPVAGVALTPRIVGGQAPEAREPMRPSQRAAKQRTDRPLSFEPLDPRATISRTSSGRIFMGAPTGVFPYPALQPTERPYAQPSFQMIGAPSGRHMAADMKLTHGSDVTAIATTPKVVWLEQPVRRKPASRRAK
jgi:hypothetical protein